jgi:pimeloyl-ACP methyl ester carboxylesterase
VPLFARLGFQVWAPNQRGYGNSAMPRGRAAYAVEKLMADVAGLVDAARCDEVVLVGHDWGALVAWRFAALRVRPLARLVILNVPHPTRFQEEIRTNRDQRKRSRYAAFFQLPWLPERLLTRRNAEAVAEAFRGMAVDKSRFPDDVLAVYRENALRPGGMTAMLNWYRAAGPRFGKREALPLIETPTLVIWGEEDSALAKELSYGTERHVKDLGIRYLPGVSHWVQQEAPEAVNEMLEAWLAGRPVPGNAA